VSASDRYWYVMSGVNTWLTRHREVKVPEWFPQWAEDLCNAERDQSKALALAHKALETGQKIKF